MNAKDKDQDHAYQQAAAQMSSIAAMVAALECDYERLEELRDTVTLSDGTAPDPGVAALMLGDGLVAPEDIEAFTELAELEEAAACGESQACYACKDADEARERITEDALDVELFGTWHPGETPEPEGFTILLCTGGPAVRIKGLFDGHRQPERAWLEYQDWGTPWTEYHGENMDHDALLTYCQQFYFGE